MSGIVNAVCARSTFANRLHQMAQGAAQTLAGRNVLAVAKKVKQFVANHKTAIGYGLLGTAAVVSLACVAPQAVLPMAAGGALLGSMWGALNGLASARVEAATGRHVPEHFGRTAAIQGTAALLLTPFAPAAGLFFAANHAANRLSYTLARRLAA